MKSEQSINLNFKIEGVELSIAENNMINDIKNLYRQALIFKRELKNQPNL